ncbi:MAG: hypothetical protein EA397_10565 [Deltaproteobacteria bacterium]|nr:MAG: hypothetical protein EA397_10565 [Deltaproteobacteria bacterium]
MSTTEPTPTPTTLGSEFYLWLWWRSEEEAGRFDVGESGERIELFVDDRLAFRIPGETKVTAVLTGDNASESVEAKAALFGGKILQELRVRLRRDDRDFVVTLKGPEVHLTRVKLPQVLGDNEFEAILDRMSSYDELVWLVGELFTAFGRERASDAWTQDIEPRLRAWVEGSVRG